MRGAFQVSSGSGDRRFGGGGAPTKGKRKGKRKKGRKPGKGFMPGGALHAAMVRAAT
jgi:hypothetical protein